MKQCAAVCITSSEDGRRHWLCESCPMNGKGDKAIMDLRPRLVHDCHCGRPHVYYHGLEPPIDMGYLSLPAEVQEALERDAPQQETL